MSDQSTARAAGWSLLQRWAERALSLVTFAVLSRLLVPEDFGLLAIAVVFLVLLRTVIEETLSQAVIRARDLDPELLDTTFWLSLALGTFLCALCAAAAGPVSDLYDAPELAGVLRILGLTLILGSGSAVQAALMSRGLRFRELGIRRLVAAVAGGVVGIVWAVVSPSVWALVAQMMATGLVGTVLLWRFSDYRPGRAFDRDRMRELIAFGASLVGIRFFATVSQYGDNLLVSLFLGVRQVGLYAVGYRIYQIIAEICVGALSAVALPTFSRLQDDLPRLRSALLRATAVSAVGVAPVFAAIAALAPDLIPFVFGDQWDESVPVAQALCLLGVLNCVNFFDRSVLIAVGRERLELVIVGIAATGNLAAVAIGATFGITAVAYALVIRAYLFWPLRIWALKTSIGLSARAYLSSGCRRSRAQGECSG